MSDAAAAPKPKSKKKLLVIVLVLVIVLALAAGGALFFLKKKNAAAADEEDGDGEPAAAAAAHDDPKHPPTFLPVDNLVVNLADPGGERFAQIGITFQVADAHASDDLKNSMPKVRNAILVLASQKTAEELLSRDGKEKLAKAILGEASKVFGFEPEEEEAAPADGEAPKKKKKKKKAPEHEGGNPVQAVLFSSFIIQ